MSDDCQPARGAVNIAEFAPKFVRDRMKGFRKDLDICLTRAPRRDKAGWTHAYFPALGYCCSMLEYLAALQRGNIRNVGRTDLVSFAARYMPQPAYDAEAIRVLHGMFRNTVNHRGIASGVWPDQAPATRGRRMVWGVSAANRAPAIEVRGDVGELTRDPPWPCPHTHRVYINLGRLWRDIERAAFAYADAVGSDARLLANFEVCMKQLYPK